MGTRYTDDFYETIADGSRTSASVVVPMLMERLAPKTVVDVGCGRGWWGHEFERHGCDVIGLDGEYVEDRLLERFIEADLRRPLPDLPKADLVVCLEVAEHLPTTRAESFIAELAQLGEHVLFSAAIPHQRGVGHINLRWQSYWVGLFAAHGLGADTEIRDRIWNDDAVEPWYRQNILLMRRHHTTAAGVIDVVHPIIHEWGRTT